jgi:hypothetical protein
MNEKRSRVGSSARVNFLVGKSSVATEALLALASLGKMTDQVCLNIQEKVKL